jgi:anti-sigma-K factor RskA
MAPQNAIDSQDSRLDEASVWPPRGPRPTDADDGALLWRLALAAALAVIALAAAGSLLA